MAIAFDAAAGSIIGGSSLTYSHTCTGSDRILFVGVTTEGADDPVTGVTYAGSALTQIGKIEGGGDATSKWQYLYYIIAPATGANDVVISRSGSSTIGGCSASYTGAKQTGVPDASNTGRNTSPGTSLSVSVTTVADNSWTVMGIFSDGGGIAATTGTIRNGQSGNFTVIMDSNSAKTPAGSTSLAISSVSGSIGGVMASFAPVAVASNGNFLAFM